MMSSSILTEKTKTYPIIEIFSSIQGEGIYVGQKHLFLRFDYCNIACTYCDELHKKSEERTIDSICLEIENLLEERGEHSFLSFTGGEPLLYPQAILSICEQFKGRLKFYLETNGNLPQKLDLVLEEMDVIAMDIKLKSISETENTFRENRLFLKQAIDAEKDVFIKIVIGENLDLDEFHTALDLVSQIDDSIPLVLQPLSAKEEVSVAFLTQIQKIASEKLEDVRVIPRLHEILNVR